MKKVADVPKKTTSWLALLLITLGSAVFGWYVLFTGRGLELEYDRIAAMDAKTATLSAAIVELPNNEKPLHVPSWSLFSLDGPWMYVSKTRPLPSSYAPVDLVTVSLPHGGSSDVQLNKRVAQQLTALFAAAEADGESLMISSAYRSIADQKKLYDDFVETKGEAMAKQYVALPGTSEHHTGLAVDITNASNACTKDTDNCNLSSSTAAWLADHAPNFGFIIRYPSGKQPVTGVAYEPWHLRYVGIAMAKKATAADMAYDEIVEQIAPGRVKTVTTDKTE